MLRYQYAKQAITWLCDAFGFEVFLNVPGKDDQITHARLTLGTNMIMLASLDREEDVEKLFVSPTTAGGVTQSTSLYVENPDEIYTKAIAAGAAIIDEIDDFQFGGRTFTCQDPESHLWVITSHDPWKKIW
jgi:uncharacterized glyoxalase superfamily protein PhnB